MKIAVLKETYPGERRVALTPAALAPLKKADLAIVVESGAGMAAGYADAAYRDKGAEIAENRAAAMQADVLLYVRTLGADREQAAKDKGSWAAGKTIIGMADPLGSAEFIRELAPCGANFFALELVPRITRAQAMDVLSSQATIAGYKAVLLAADHAVKMFPLMMTAAGTISPARVMVLGAGVAGLQAIATARRLGAVVEAYDVRSEVREQIESLGAKFLEMEVADDAQDASGYARQMDEAFYQKQRAFLAEHARHSDVVITTAAIPGKKSPLLLTEDAVKAMPEGGVIVDLAAERGGNCELTKADETVIAHGVTILGPTNLPSDIPFHASQMYANNCVKFLLNLYKDGELQVEGDDEIVVGTLAAKGGEVVHTRLREILNLRPLEKPEEKKEEEPPPNEQAEEMDFPAPDNGQGESGDDDASASEEGENKETTP